jgi:hypothetical protein
MIGICKFCGCTDSTPCLIPASYITDPDFVASVAGGVPCAWLLEEVCTAPACVAKAYVEACALIDQMLAGGGVGGMVHGVSL